MSNKKVIIIILVVVFGLSCLVTLCALGLFGYSYYRSKSNVHPDIYPTEPATDLPLIITPSTGEPVDLGDLTDEDLDYFFEIAMNSEYDANLKKVTKKWQKDVKIEVKGSPTAEDLATLEDVIADLNELTTDDVDLEIAEAGERANSTMWFVPVDEMKNYEPNYREDNWGYFYINWKGNFEIYKANILIGSDLPNQLERNHLIREELTQSLGLINDSYEYPDSIFYIEWTTTQEFSELDKELIGLLYSPQIKPDMTEQEVLNAID